MKRITENCKIPILSWCENPEEGALAQARNLSNLPYAFEHIALMPDTHQGYGMPIGGVLATKNVIIPNAVGVDIGCGMCSVTSNINKWHAEDLKSIRKKLGFAIPIGFGRHIQPKDMSKLPEPMGDEKLHHHGLIEKATYYVGTLGGGNHFIEFQMNRSGYLCIMIHSGSRNLGKTIADWYNNKAKELAEKYFKDVPPAWDLAGLPLDSEEGQNYLTEMEYCVEFALANRQEMMREVEGAIFDLFKPRQKVVFDNFINIPHNYARVEKHYGYDVVVHRKGSTSAKEGEIGLIPGSQGTKSYCVKGKGSMESFESCSHGAGRIMGRNQAKKTLDLQKEIARLDKLGIIHDVESEADLDEAAGSYKDIDLVMKEQEDLVKVVDEYVPLAVYGKKKTDKRRRK